MKNPDRKTVSRLVELPNIGKKMAHYFESVGIHDPQQLIGKDAFEIYQKLNDIKETKFDPCVIGAFMSVIHFMEGGRSLPWWSFTEERKRILAEKK